MKDIIVIGDRVLIKPDESEEKTEVGLYLPQTVKARDEIARGFIVKTGPGIPLADPSNFGDEPWSNSEGGAPRYLPMEVAEGDYALFLRKAVVEIFYEGEKYYIGPQSAILLLIRDRDDTPDLLADEPPLDFE
ncbi:MAG: co-chaperone GroES [Calditrichaeota bacterium]|nr:co-chaperone GroES [Calditrichota bacterium]MCB0305788.1 co-chaperone GroES [Calditrichota bacterium]MCB0313182.1 co-chaperone GroES [Calditrichota bacterium]MCB9090838.1 co-chaperone GroES [Calditrichia bacterium]